MSKSKRNSKIRARKAHQSSTEVRFSRHVWSRVEDDQEGGDGTGTGPVVGYSYQSFGGDIFFSLIRPTDAISILRQLEAGRKLTTNMLLHFSDEQVEPAISIMTHDDIAMEAADGFHMAGAAYMHMRMENRLLALAITRHLVQSSMSWEDFAKRCRIFAVESMHEKALEEIRSIWDEANSYEVMCRLEHALQTKNTNSTTVKI